MIIKRAIRDEIHDKIKTLIPGVSAPIAATQGVHKKDREDASARLRLAKES